MIPSTSPSSAPETSASPVWQRINRAVKAGQTHESAQELREELARILGTSTLPPVHGGMNTVVERLRSGDGQTIDALERCPIVTLRHTALTAHMMERTWGKLQSSTMPTTGDICTTYDRELAARSVSSVAYDRIAVLAKKTAEAKLASLSASEQIGSGMRGATGPMLELLSVLVEHTAEDIASDPERGWERTVGIAERSIPAFLAALSASTADVLRSLMLACAQKPDKPTRVPSLKQDPTQYRIARDHRGNEILTTADEHNAIIPDVIAGPGCAAKYARDTDGIPVSASVIQKILRQWKTAAPRVLADVTGFRSGGSLRQAHRDFLSSLRERIGA